MNPGKDNDRTREVKLAMEGKLGLERGCRAIEGELIKYSSKRPRYVRALTVARS